MYLYIMFVILFKVSVVEVVAGQLSNESALPRTTDSTPQKPWSTYAGSEWIQTVVLYVDSNLPDDGSSSVRFHHVHTAVVETYN